MHIYLVGCGKLKRSKPSEARYLYTSDYFSKKARLSERVAGPWWWVLSAEYELVHSRTVIPPYDTTMDDRDSQKWGTRTAMRLEAIHPLHETSTELTVLAGQDYVSPIRGYLDTLPATTHFPFDGTSGNGDQKRVLKRRLREVSNTSLTEY